MRNWLFLALWAIPALAAAAEPEKTVIIEARFLRLPDKPYQDLKLAETLEKTEYKFLEVKDLAELLTAVEKCKTATITAAPKLTVENNQYGSIDLTRNHTYVAGLSIVADAHGGATVEPKMETRPVGLNAHFIPRVTADGQRVRLRVEVTETAPCPARQLQVTTPVTPIFEGGSIGMPVTETRFIEPGIFDCESVKKNVVIPDGKSMVLKLRSSKIESCDFGPPMFSRIPYINRLFKTNDKVMETVHSCVVLTVKLEPGAKVAPVPFHALAFRVKPEPAPLPAPARARETPMDCFAGAPVTVPDGVAVNGEFWRKFWFPEERPYYLGIRRSDPVYIMPLPAPVRAREVQWDCCPVADVRLPAPCPMPAPPAIAPSPIRFAVPLLGPAPLACDQRLHTEVFEFVKSAPQPQMFQCTEWASSSPFRLIVLPCQFAECKPCDVAVTKCFPGFHYNCADAPTCGFAAISPLPQAIPDGGTACPQGVCGYTLMRFGNDDAKPVSCWPQAAPVTSPSRIPPLPVASAPAKTILCDGKATVQEFDGKMMLTAERVEIRTNSVAKNPVILKVLLEQYDVASKAGDAEKARIIAAYCLDMDPTCFAKR